MSETSCPKAHPIWTVGGPGPTFVDTLEVLGSHATDDCVQCRLCGRVFWTVCDMGKWQVVADREVDPALARKAVVEHDPAALATLFVTNELPYGPLWDLTGALVEIFRALTPATSDAERARALRDAGGAAGRWTEAIRVLETAARAASHSVREAVFPVDVRLSGRSFREWFEVGDALVLLTEQHEMLRLEGRGVTRLDLAGRPRWVASSPDRLTLAVGDAALLVIDAAGVVSTWDAKGPFKAEALDEGWWLHVPDTGEPVRVIEMRKPDGRPCVGFKRAFGKDGWMPPPRRMGDGWILTNLIDDEGATQALSLVDARWKLVAQSGACPAADRRVTVIDPTKLVAEIDGAVERWVRKGAALELVETIPCRQSSWIKDRLITDGPDGVVTARSDAGVVWWTWSRQRSGATYGADGRDGILFYDDDHAYWLTFDGKLRKTFDVETPSVMVGKEGTIYLKSLTDLWVLVADEAHLLAVDMNLELETVCGDDVVLRDERGACLLVDRDRHAARFEAPGAHFPVTGTRGGPWVVEGDRVRGAFEKNAHLYAEAIAMTVGATSRILPEARYGQAAMVVLPDGRVPYLVTCWSPGYGRIEFAGGGAWHFAAKDDAAVIVKNAAAALKGWLASSSPAKPSLYEIGLAVLDVVTATFGERWSLSIPGTVHPTEMWLWAPGRAAGAIGVFDGRVNVAAVEVVPITNRGDLVLRRDAIVAAAKEQRARYERYAARTGALMDMAHALASRLSVRLGKTCEVVAWGATSYEGTVAPRIFGRDDSQRTLVWLRDEDERIHVHGGAWGRAGWSTDGADVEEMIEPLAEAIERGEDLFCVGRLKTGARYRVASDYDKLEKGEIVTCEGLDDIDNHYGELVFKRADGSEVRVGGDYSNRETGWVGELYLVFENV